MTHKRDWLAMTEVLQGPRLKLQRARQLLVSLRKAEQAYFKDSPCRIVYDDVSKPGHKLAKVKLDAPPPEIIHVYSGEIIYHLRSALDQTAVAFARLSGGKARPKEVYYPTGNSFKSFVNNCKSVAPKKPGQPIKLMGNLRYFSPRLRRAILQTRPYDGANDSLRAVFRMANIDKHMELIAVSASGQLNGMINYTIRDANIGIIMGESGNLNEGVIFSDLTPNGAIEPKSKDARLTARGEIVLGNVGIDSGKPLVTLLSTMIAAVESAHESFERVIGYARPVNPRTGMQSTNILGGSSLPFYGALGWGLASASTKG
jgi:hypothetical protein